MKINEKEFWEYSPRKLFSLIIEFNDMNTPAEEKKEVKKASVEDFDAFLRSR